MIAFFILVTAYILGFASLALFGVFLWAGPFPIFDANLNAPIALACDALLCFVFFLQHSGMVRKSFRDRLAAVVAIHYQPAFYAIVSAIALLLLLLLWQPSRLPLLSLDGFARGLARGAFLAAIAGLAWGIGSLKYFDPFGRGPILAHHHGRPAKALPLIIRGPYRWVRHPLYAFMLALIWACPDLSVDRVLFNVLWTSWIIVGTVLEERDLASTFGEDYRKYRRSVPMLVPSSLRPRV